MLRLMWYLTADGTVRGPYASDT